MKTIALEVSEDCLPCAMQKKEHGLDYNLGITIGTYWYLYILLYILHHTYILH